jgi:hypothetical protein
MSDLKFYNSNSNLKAAGQSIGYTKEQLEEYLKCAEDPIYFINNYCMIVTLDNGLQKFTLYPCQVNKINVIHRNRMIILMEGRQQGKCVEKSSSINIKNKTTGEIYAITAEEFHEMCKQEMSRM